jgi:hypothetical protein
LNRQYDAEAHELERGAPKAAEAPILRRHEVLVLVDRLDVAAARALQYARTLMPDGLRAVHFDLDPVITEDLAEAWTRLGLSRFPLEIVECADRRIGRATAELVVGTLDGETEVSVLLPRRRYTRIWHGLLHDRTASAIAEALAPIPHCNVTIVPYHLGMETARHLACQPAGNGHGRSPALTAPVPAEGLLPPDAPDRNGHVPIAAVRARLSGQVVGRIHAVRVQPSHGVPTLEAPSSMRPARCCWSSSAGGPSPG